MLFVNRKSELERLDQLVRRPSGGLAVVYGRRRLGKTRLLIEWVARHGGLYTVADRSSARVQMQYVAQAVSSVLPGFADVEYPDWATLLSRLAREAKSQQFRGPIVFDELPYLAESSPELPSVLQRWIDHDANDASLIVAIAGSSQRMMQGLVLAESAPLFGRASEMLQIRPLEASYLREALGMENPRHIIEAYAAWGGVPRYWELADGLSGSTLAHVEHLVLDPQGPLHREPDRLLLEETPTAADTRPIFDAIGAGAHRVSEIGSRVGRPTTSMARPLGRLVEMQLIRREVPFGDSELRNKRSLYRIDDPFFRLWFRVVAPNRARLAVSSRDMRRALLARHWDGLVSMAWEELCRMSLPHLDSRARLGKAGRWSVGLRWWKGRNDPEWDVVAETADRDHLLLGEVKWRLQALQQVPHRSVGRRAGLESPAPHHRGVPSQTRTLRPRVGQRRRTRMERRRRRDRR
ncbi:MAG: ATP-binding protein [Candidatus Eisenbacteria bacterium]